MTTRSRHWASRVSAAAYGHQPMPARQGIDFRCAIAIEGVRIRARRPAVRRPRRRARDPAREPAESDRACAQRRAPKGRWRCLSAAGMKRLVGNSRIRRECDGDRRTPRTGAVPARPDRLAVSRVSGSRPRPARPGLDLLGVIVLAKSLTAIGGGPLRDLAADRHPKSLLPRTSAMRW